MGLVWGATRLSEEKARQVLADEDVYLEFIESDEAFNCVGFDIDKSWGAIHFMLTGEPYECDHPLSRVLFGGEPVEFDDEDMIRYRSAEDVRATAAALGEVGVEQFRSRYDPKAMAKKDVYLGRDYWKNVDPSTLDEYIVPYFKELKEGYAAAAAAGDALIVTFS